MSAVTRVSLTRIEAAEAAQLVTSIGRAHAAADSVDLLEEAARLGHGLPTSVSDALVEFRYAEDAAALHVRGFSIGQVSATPAYWNSHDPSALLATDLWLVLLSAQLGDAVSWSSLQAGRLITDIMPIRRREDEQTGHGSTAALDLHVEDAFSDARCDHLGLMCLRNDDAVATTVAGIGSVDIEDPGFDVLFEPRYLIRPDDEHLRNLAAQGVDTASLTHEPIPVLTGSRTAPHLRLDPPYMSAEPGDAAAERALDLLIGRLADAVEDVHLAPGEVLLVDNHRALHGRQPFAARYDGTDRWLRRITTVRDLRRSRAWRYHARRRVIDPTGQLAGNDRPPTRPAGVLTRSR